MSDDAAITAPRLSTVGAALSNCTNATVANPAPTIRQALNGEMSALKEVRDGLWHVVYSDTLLGRFDELTRTITGAPSLNKDH